MAFATDSRITSPRRPSGLGRHLSVTAATMWAHIIPWLPTCAGFWAMTVGQPLVLARVRPNGPRRFRSAAD